MPTSAPDTSWFIRDRLGLFIHWGLYALPARHEWVQNREKIPEDKYRKYFDHFDPDLYDPRVWAQEARNAGMKYFVITTKHHEGFCLWDSDLTDYKATRTPCGKDLLKPMVEAFRAEGLRAGFYHSLIDWHHPEFTVDGMHPLRDDLQARAKPRDITKYAAYLHGQVRELCTRFGKVDIFWFDFSYPNADWTWSKGKGRNDWQSEKLLSIVRELQPQALVDNRLDLPNAGDFHTPEQSQPRGWVEVNGQRVVWEACHTFSGSWGYYRDEHTWKSTEMLIQLLVDCVSKGGNLLLNVGPTGRGECDYRAIDRLRGLGAWMKYHSRAIYGCTASEFAPPADGRYTQNGKRLYLHLLSYPFKHVHLDGLAGKVEYVQFLHDASEVRYFEPKPLEAGASPTPAHKAQTLTLELPPVKPPVTVPVVEIFLK